MKPTDQEMNQLAKLGIHRLLAEAFHNTYLDNHLMPDEHRPTEYVSRRILDKTTRTMVDLLRAGVIKPGDLSDIREYMNYGETEENTDEGGSPSSSGH